jgi:hypothetical protein
MSRRAREATGVVVLLAFALGGVRPAGAFVTPPPGGALAWSTGGALLADCAGPLAVFDAPARLADSTGGAGFAVGAARASLFELDALTRVRIAATARRGSATAALGIETFGPPGFRARRAVLALAHTAQAASWGAAWSERATTTLDGARARGRTLDVAGSARLPGRLARLEALLAARSLVAAGDPQALADPDWTLEMAVDLGGACAHLVRTRDLEGARSGAGVTFAVGGLTIAAGAVGPPVQWSLGVGVTRAGHGRPQAAFGRVVHPELGASDALEGSAAW